jgi:DNA repair protein RadC
MKDPGQYLKISAWAEEDRPREKLLLKGRSSLSDAELIAILFGTGTKAMSAVDLAKHILDSVGNDLDDLAKLSVKELKKFKGVGEAKAISLISALELGKRRKNHIGVEKPKINSSKDAWELIKPELLDLDREEFWIMLLNRANKLIKKECISQGGVSGTVADPKLIFKSALENLASGVILVHNHPSGNTKPSTADIQLTNKMKEGGKFLEITVLDHIIFTDKAYFSFSDEGML